MELVSVAILLGDPVLVGVVGNISACHADARGSIPRRGAYILGYLHYFYRWIGVLRRILFWNHSGVAQRKRVGLITQRSEDRNLPPLLFAGPQVQFRREPRAIPVRLPRSRLNVG